MARLRRVKEGSSGRHDVAVSREAMRQAGIARADDRSVRAMRARMTFEAGGAPLPRPRRHIRRASPLHRRERAAVTPQE